MFDIKLKANDLLTLPDLGISRPRKIKDLQARKIRKFEGKIVTYPFGYQGLGIPDQDGWIQAVVYHDAKDFLSEEELIINN